MKKSWAILGTSTLVAATLLSTTVYAATDSFNQQYQANSQQEASLSQQIQNSGVTSDNISALETTVSTINTQVTNLYDALQSLDSGVTSIPQVNQTQFADLKSLEGKRQEIISANDKAYSNMLFDAMHHQLSALKHDSAEHMYWSEQLNTINSRIKNVESKYNLTGAPYDGARPYLEDSILRLQNSAIGYTNEILQLQSSATSTSTTSAQTSN